MANFIPTRGITWAAFFGDCEHEVSVVREGYRVTLTYVLHRDHGNFIPDN